MIAYPSVTKRSIRFHYDLSTLFYRLMWGRHIHHGLWEANEFHQRGTAAADGNSRIIGRSQIGRRDSRCRLRHGRVDDAPGQSRL